VQRHDTHETPAIQSCPCGYRRGCRAACLCAGPVASNGVVHYYARRRWEGRLQRDHVRAFGRVVAGPSPEQPDRWRWGLLYVQPPPRHGGHESFNTWSAQEDWRVRIACPCTVLTAVPVSLFLEVELMNASGAQIAMHAGGSTDRVRTTVHRAHPSPSAAGGRILMLARNSHTHIRVCKCTQS
jgi:hypothetical protein